MMHACDDSCPANCLPAKLAYWREEGRMQVDPRATPSRRNTIPPRKSNNSWEKGIARDDRGVPYMDPRTLEPMPIHHLAHNRSRIEQARAGKPT